MKWRLYIVLCKVCMHAVWCGCWSELKWAHSERVCPACVCMYDGAVHMCLWYSENVKYASWRWNDACISCYAVYVCMPCGAFVGPSWNGLVVCVFVLCLLPCFALTPTNVWPESVRVGLQCCCCVATSAVCGGMWWRCVCGVLTCVWFLVQAVRFAGRRRGRFSRHGGGSRFLGCCVSCVFLMLLLL